MRASQAKLTLSVGLVLAVTLGLNLVVFSFVNALYLRPLPVRNASRVAFLAGGGWAAVQSPAFSRLDPVAGQVQTDGVYANLRSWFEIDGGETIQSAAVTPEYFRLFGIDIRGRDFQEADDRAAAEPVAIISDALWAQAFQRRDDIIGSVVMTRPFPIRIIGVATRGFQGARRGEHLDMWIPSTSARRFGASESAFIPLQIMGRLKWGHSFRSINEAFRAEYPRAGVYNFVPLDSVFGGSDAPAVLIHEGQSLAVVGVLALLVLAGGCTSVAATVLIAYERRQMELSIRQALGASQEQLISSLVKELAVMAAAGAAGGLAFAWLCLRSMPALRLANGTALNGLDLSIDWRVMLAGVVSSAFALAAAAAFPVARVTRDQVMAVVRSSSTSSITSHRLRQGLLASLAAATIVVLVCAGLFLQAVLRGFSVAPGFDLDHAIFATVRLGPLPTNVPPRQAVAEAARSISQSLRAQTGVSVVAQANRPIDTWAVVSSGQSTRVRIGDRQESYRLGWMPGSPEQRAALGVPLMAGRDLTEADRLSLPVPALITSTFAQRLFQGRSPLGQELVVNAPRGHIVIVGVLGDFAFGSLSSPPDGSLIVPTADDSTQGDLPHFIVGTSDSASAIVSRLRHDLSAQRHDIAIAEFLTAREAISRDLARQQLGAWFFSGFGGVAFMLEIGCVFGLVSYLMKSRRPELAVRMSLGASGWHIMRLAIRSALVPVAAGSAVGVVVAATATRGLSSILIGLNAADPMLYVAIAGAMIATCATAAGLAALSVRNISPSELLRSS